MNGLKYSVIILNDTAHIDGGAARVALSSAIGLARRGHRVTLFTAVAPIELPGEQPPTLEVVCTGQCDILSDPSRVAAGLRGLWNRVGWRRLQEVVSAVTRERTVIHIHGWSKALSPSVLHLVGKAGLPAVATLHDYFLACPNGGFYNYQRQAHCKLSPLSLACVTEACDVRCYSHKFWRLCRLLIQRQVAHYPGAIRNFIVLSEYSRRLLEPYLSPAAKLFLLSNPVDVALQKSAIPPDDAPFVFAGRLSAEKGPELFAQAIARSGVSGVVIGDGPLRSLLQATWPQLNFTDWLGTEDVHRRLRQARALVFPSRCHEVQGLVVLEAAALGVASIVSDGSAARELVIDGVTGLWFKHGDVSDLSKKIEMLQNDLDLAFQLGNAAHSRFWADPPTLERHIDQLEAVYAELSEAQ